jgi:hypothetical protein
VRLIKGKENECVYTSLAMLLNVDVDVIKRRFTLKLEDTYPFEFPFEQLPRVPCMEEVCLEVVRRDSSLTPFPRVVEATPHPDCPPIKVWGDEKFFDILCKGPGLIEGMVKDRGHMVAWDGHVVYDPRGYCYSINVADKFDFDPKRFWLHR